MPTYDYRCTECGRVVEVMHGIYGSGPETCEHCGGAMRKALSTPAIHFKGKGWAKKDAAATARKAAPKADSKDDKADAKGDKESSKGEPQSNTGDAAKAEAGSKSSTSSDSKGQASSTAGSKTD